MNTIRYLSVLNLPLFEIADFLGNRDVERIEEKLCQQKETVTAKQVELKRIERLIIDFARLPMQKIQSLTM